MATLAQPAVTVNGTWTTDGPNSRTHTTKDVTLVLTGQGGSTNTILAALFGFAFIDYVENARSATKIYNAVAAFDKSTIWFQPPISTAKYYIATGLASTGPITATGVATTDTLLAVNDLTTPAALSLANFSITAANTITQASGAGDLHLKTLQFITSQATGLPADITDTVRLLVTGY